MPITATLAMVAAAAMAGVPLLNGFLSKEMFFAETIEDTRQLDALDQALPYIVTTASMFTVAYSLRFIGDVFFGPAADELPRTPHEPPFLMRFPVEFLVLACLLVGIVPGFTIGPLLEPRSTLSSGRHSGLQPCRLAWLHSRALDELGGDFRRRSHVLDVARHICCGTEGPPLLRHHQGSAHFRPRARRRLVAARKMVGGAAWHAPLAAAIAAADLRGLLAGLAPVFAHGIGVLGDGANPFDFAFALIWAVGAPARWPRLTGQIPSLCGTHPLGGAGLVTCVTFVWLSAPDLALTQLVVGDRHDRAASARAALAAEAHQKVRGTGDAIRRRRSATSASRSPRRRGGPGGAGLRGR